jgi:hypothetical protein
VAGFAPTGLDRYVEARLAYGIGLTADRGGFHGVINTGKGGVSVDVFALLILSVGTEQDTFHIAVSIWEYHVARQPKTLKLTGIRADF